MHARSFDGQEITTFPGIMEADWVRALEQVSGRTFEEDSDEDSDEDNGNTARGQRVCDELGFSSGFGFDAYSVTSDGLLDSGYKRLDSIDWLSRLRGLQPLPRRDESGQPEQRAPDVDVIMPVKFSKRVGREALGVIRAYHWENEEVLAEQGGELDDAAQLMCGGGEWRVPASFDISDEDAIALVKRVARHFQENWGFAGNLPYRPDA